MKIALVLSLALSLALGAGARNPARSAPIGTGFSYQGELAENGIPMTGTAHLRFSLYDASGSGSPPVGGSHIGSSHLLTDVPVTNGVFTVVLNDAGQFGVSAFNGDARWIQVEVCDDASCSSTTVLGPRQPIAGVPYALTATKPWEISGVDLSYSAGNVGIGTMVPASRLQVLAGYTGDGIRLVGGPTAAPGYHLFDGGLDRGSLGLATLPGLWSTDALGGDIVLRSTAGRLLLQNGIFGSALAISGNNVGLGTTSPTARLDVRGEVKLGPNGEYYAPSGEESLRIVRGEVDGNGNVTAGCCVTVVWHSTGVYDVNFTNWFSGQPVVTVTPVTNYYVTATVDLVGPDSFRVVTRFDGDIFSSNFTFIAMGPR